MVYCYIMTNIIMNTHNNNNNKRYNKALRSLNIVIVISCLSHCVIMMGIFVGDSFY